MELIDSIYVAAGLPPRQPSDLPTQKNPLDSSENRSPSEPASSETPFADSPFAETPIETEDD
jgi:hypothetical protein